MKQIYIAWVGFQRRQVSMKEFFGFETIFLPVRSKRKMLKLIEYVSNYFRSFSVIVETRPDVVWVQLPQVPLLWAAFMYKWLVKYDTKVVADCHTGMFLIPWVKMPFGVSMIKRCDLVLVHNEFLVGVARELGMDMHSIKVLEDPPANISTHVSEAKLLDVPRPWLLFPASFQNDEPIEELLNTAALVPNASFLITGDHKSSAKINKISNIPSNVKFLGYLPVAAFDRYLRVSDVIIGLTSLENAQLSVANEAIGIGKPMVLSGTEVLRKLFYKGAVFVDSSNPESIARGCLEALDRLENLATESSALREERKQMWDKNQAQPIREILDAKYSK